LTRFQTKFHPKWFSPPNIKVNVIKSEIDPILGKKFGERFSNALEKVIEIKYEKNR